MAKRRQCSSCGAFNAYAAKECKDCGSVFGQMSDARSYSPTTCAWESFGNPCSHRGVISASTNGEGQSYCRQHWDEINGITPTVRGNQLPTREVKPGLPAWQYSGWDMSGKRWVEAVACEELEEA